jgi:hypothetical protein
MPNIFLNYRQLPAETCRAFDTRVFQTYQVTWCLAVHDPQVPMLGGL